MVRLIDADAIEHCLVIGGRRHGKTIISEIIRRAIQTAPTVDAVPVIRCKDCKHRPIVIDAEGNGFDYDFPDERCPCQCEDGWYNWMPRDEWYCANGERKEE